MDAQQARYLLQAGRPRPGDADEAAFQEALALAGADPELGAWLDRQQAVTDALRRKLHEVPVPAGLKERILAGGVVTRPVKHRQRRQWLALAAGVALLLALGGWQLTRFQPGGGRDYAALRADMTAFLSGYFSLELHSRQLQRVKDHLATEHAFADYEIPAALAGQESVGCRKIDWHNGRVMLICFSVDHQLVHLFITPRTGVSPVPAANGQFAAAQEGDFATVGWSDERNVYLVATPGSAGFLKRTLSGGRG